MPQLSPPFGRLAALAILASTGLGARLGALPELEAPPGWGALALLGGAASAWMLLRRPARPLPPLGLQVRPPPASQTLDGVLRFVSAAPLAWCARRGEWSLDLDGGGPADLPWRMELRRDGWQEPALPLARAATLDAVLTASRRLYATRPPKRGQGDPALCEAAHLLGCDLEFSLPSLRQRMTALAEGGYALHDETGCRALSPPTADALLGEAGRVHGVPD